MPSPGKTDPLWRVLLPRGQGTQSRISACYPTGAAKTLRAREQAPHREPRDRTWVTRAGGGEASQQKREYDEVALESLDPKRTGGNESQRRPQGEDRSLGNPV